MKGILKFWNKTKVQMRDAKNGDILILVPSKTLANDLRTTYIPGILKIVDKESETYSNTLLELLQFLFLYDEITHKIKTKNEDDSKLIYMMPILYKIAETKLNTKGDSKYKEHALTFHNWLRCSDCKHDECKVKMTNDV